MKTLAKWSVEDYHQMIEANILVNRRVELIAGEIVEMSPETPIHYNTAKQGAKYLEKLLNGLAEVRFNGPITLIDSESEPDIAIVRLPNSLYNTRHPYTEDVFWLIEVAQTSLPKDVNLKKCTYAKANIQEYWVLNLVKKTLIVFREPQDNNYTSEQEIKQGNISPIVFPNMQISIEKLLNE